MNTTRYTARDLFTFLACLVKPATDAIHAELRTSRDAPTLAAVQPIPVAEELIPQSAAAFSMPSAVTVPSMAPWLEITPIGAKPARKATRKPAAKRDETGTHGTLNWDAEARTVVIKSGRSSCTYAVTETPTDWDGRAFRLDKLEAGSDPESRTYSVFVCRKGQEHRTRKEQAEAGSRHS